MLERHEVRETRHGVRMKQSLAANVRQRSATHVASISATMTLTATRHMADEDHTWCECSMFDEFIIDKRWLCIPCFLVLETEANGRRLERDVYKVLLNPDKQSSFSIARTLVRKISIDFLAKMPIHPD